MFFYSQLSKLLTPFIAATTASLILTSWDLESSGAFSLSISSSRFTSSMIDPFDSLAYKLAGLSP